MSATTRRRARAVLSSAAQMAAACDPGRGGVGLAPVLTGGARCIGLAVFAVLVQVLAGCNGDVPPREPGLAVLVPGPAKLAGLAVYGCSNAEPPTADGHRWCAFFRPATAEPARTELWVIDVTRVLAGQAVPCDGTNSGCLLMTGDLFTGSLIGSPSHPEAHHFEGDTLFFLAQASPDVQELERYEGFVWAWRPGWKRPRAISTAKGLLCRGSNTAAVAYCVDNVIETRTTLTFDLRAGRLVDQTDATNAPGRTPQPPSAHSGDLVGGVLAVRRRPGVFQLARRRGRRGAAASAGGQDRTRAGPDPDRRWPRLDPGPGSEVGLLPARRSQGRFQRHAVGGRFSGGRGCRRDRARRAWPASTCWAARTFVDCGVAFLTDLRVWRGPCTCCTTGGSRRRRRWSPRMFTSGTRRKRASSDTSCRWAAAASAG